MPMMRGIIWPVVLTVYTDVIEFQMIVISMLAMASEKMNRSNAAKIHLKIRTFPFETCRLDLN
jgi:hypothetical protein